MTFSMMLPTIHLNGTSRATLVDQAAAARSALHAALEALQEAAPNGRDYYPQGNAAINAASLEHGQRMVALRAMIADMTTLYEHCVEAGRL